MIPKSLLFAKFIWYRFGIVNFVDCPCKVFKFLVLLNKNICILVNDNHALLK